MICKLFFIYFLWAFFTKSSFNILLKFKCFPQVFQGNEIWVGIFLILRIDEVTGICKAFYFGGDREKGAEFITMQNGS